APYPKAYQATRSTLRNANSCWPCLSPTSIGSQPPSHQCLPTTTPRLTPFTLPGRVQPSPDSHTTTGCRVHGCSSSGTTLSVTPTTRTPYGAIPRPTSASTCSHGTTPHITTLSRAGDPHSTPAH